MRFLTALLLCVAGSAAAHQPSTAYLALTVSGSNIEGRLDIAIDDAQRVFALDANSDGLATWGEALAIETNLQQLPGEALVLALDGEPCRFAPAPIALVEHSDGNYLALRFTSTCTRSGALDVRYNWLVDVDSDHRLLARIDHGGEQSAVFSSESRRARIEPGAPQGSAAFAAFFWQGVLHIGLGLDHLLFLSCLLLPAVVCYRGGRYEVAASAWMAFVDVVKVITAFTVAHALSLTAVTFEWLRLPVRLVEAMVAATILFAALNNVLPLARNERLWAVAFGFGAIHGAGYASVLAGLELSSASMLLALLGFNLGVEGAQVAAASIFLPVAYLFRHLKLYRLVLTLGSLLIAGVALLWLIERSFNVQF